MLLCTDYWHGGFTENNRIAHVANALGAPITDFISQGIVAESSFMTM